MDEGVTFIDPAQTYIGARATIGSDTVIYPGTHLVGRVTVGSDCRVGVYRFIRQRRAGGFPDENRPLLPPS
jgi:bifunctional UDP-N-acetylglucosamine pyrophosphorylase/glucosamine-1-phosphate N-acetyltransferase